MCNSMKSKKYVIGLFFIVPLVLGVAISTMIQEKKINLDERYDLNYNSFDIGTEPYVASSSNLDNLENLFDAILNNYSEHGYFPQRYESSLQATYYALFILDAIGKLDQIDQAAITDYIMSHYDSDTHIFMDNYAQRYLDTDIDLEYYSWTSVLEVNCYATLSLGILGNLNLINQEQIKDFIWDCYNPITHGFIGQPYDVNLPDYFKVYLMDNMYYAAITYDLLTNGNWDDKTAEQTQIRNSISGLQSTEISASRKGGFYNNEYTDYENFIFMFSNFDPSLFSSYYCLKVLELFGGVDPFGMISLPNFNSYLGELYRPGDYFIINYHGEFNNPMDLIGTALGIELSDLAGFSGINRENAINYILDNKNQLGGWNSSVEWNCYELIDTFQIVRSLKDSGEISRLTENDKNELVSYIGGYQQLGGYSLVSKDYTSLTLINTIVNSFYLYDRHYSDLYTSDIYDSLLRACVYYPRDPTFDYFKVYTQNQGALSNFRSYPIEYYNRGFHNNIEEIDLEKSHKSTYMALDTMLKLSKLNTFESNYDLNKILNSIIDSQFLNDSYSNYGAFLPLRDIKDGYEDYPEIQNKLVFFEYSYYAIRSLEILVSQLGLGNIESLGIDSDALFAYIENHFTDYFDPQYSDSIEIILQNTYYMVYLYEAFTSQNLDGNKIDKIKNYIIQNIDYSDIKSIYYCYKIDDAIDLDIPFDLNATYDLVQQIYSEQIDEYYLTPQRNTINQEIFFWICDMAKNDDITIVCEYSESVNLGGELSLKVWLRNMVLKEFGPLITVKFESEQLGTEILEKMPDYTYRENITINVPLITGNITVYMSGLKILELPITFKIIGHGTTSTPGESEGDDDDEDEGTEESNANVQVAIPLVITIIAIPSCIIALTTKLKRQVPLTREKN